MAGLTVPASVPASVALRGGTADTATSAPWACRVSDQGLASRMASRASEQTNAARERPPPDGESRRALDAAAVKIMLAHPAHKQRCVSHDRCDPFSDEHRAARLSDPLCATIRIDPHTLGSADHDCRRTFRQLLAAEPPAGVDPHFVGEYVSGLQLRTAFF